MDKEQIKKLLREILQEECEKDAVRYVPLGAIHVSESDRFQTGNSSDQVYTHDLFSLAESPRLGCGVMEMEQTTFPWTLQYDEIDYVLEGSLTIVHGNRSVTAQEGELIYIPKGSSIRFSVNDHARFLYFTYPADWQNQTGDR